MEHPVQHVPFPETVTERGLMMTVDAEVFANGRADLKGASQESSLDRLVKFLNLHSSGDVTIEGHTDSLGSEGYNHGLSQRRADAVKSYLIAHGINGRRLTALGKGGSRPVAGNNTAAGRQRNARVEVIIEQPPASQR